MNACSSLGPARQRRRVGLGHGHRVQRPLEHAARRRVVAALHNRQQQPQRGRRRESLAAAEAAVLRVEGALQAAQRRGDEGRGVGRRQRIHVLRARERVRRARGMRFGGRTIVPELGPGAQREAVQPRLRPAVVAGDAAGGRVRAAVGQHGDEQRIGALGPQPDGRGRVEVVEVRAQQAIGAREHELALHQARGGLVAQRVGLVEPAPGAGGVADQQQHRPAGARRLVEHGRRPGRGLGPGARLVRSRERRQ